jgi:hypothetical protein
VYLLPAGSSKPEFSVLPHRPEAISQWVEQRRGLVDDVRRLTTAELSSVSLTHLLTDYLRA